MPAPARTPRARMPQADWARGWGSSGTPARSGAASRCAHTKAVGGCRARRRRHGSRQCHRALGMCNAQLFEMRCLLCGWRVAVEPRWTTAPRHGSTPHTCIHTMHMHPHHTHASTPHTCARARSSLHAHTQARVLHVLWCGQAARLSASTHSRSCVHAHPQTRMHGH